MKPVKRHKLNKVVDVDSINYITMKGSDIVELSSLLLDFGFRLDGKKYLVNGNKVVSSNWGKNIAGIVAKAKSLPRIGYALNSMAIKVWHKYELLKIEYEVWTGREWTEGTRVGSGLQDAPMRKIQAYISSRPENVRFLTELSELKAIHARLKAVIAAVQQQHYSILAILNVYKRNPSEDIGNTAFSSIDVTRVYTTNNEDLDDVKNAMFGERE